MTARDMALEILDQLIKKCELSERVLQELKTSNPEGSAASKAALDLRVRDKPTFVQLRRLVLSLPGGKVV